MNLLPFLTWMDNLPSSIALRESTWTYPAVESIHSVGICLFVGLTLLWDLRLMGVGLRKVPVSEVWSRLIPWMTLGALAMMLTGVALFYSKPLFFWSNIFFRLKLVALALALVNAMAFHFGIEKKLVDWDTSPRTPLAAKLAGASSMALWAIVIVFGRFIAYNWFAPL
jgi:hypothetical protein